MRFSSLFGEYSEGFTLSSGFEIKRQHFLLDLAMRT